MEPSTIMQVGIPVLGILWLRIREKMPWYELLRLHRVAKLREAIR
jgi:hypothetical protein